MKKSWKVHALCECGWHTEIPLGEMFFIDQDVCPNCGEPKTSWERQAMRFIGTAKWWNPLTWMDGDWEIKNEN